MKKFFILLILAVLSLTSADAQMRIKPMVSITNRSYDEAIELTLMMYSNIQLEMYEGIYMDRNAYFTTRYGEFIVQREGSKSIKISNGEFSSLLNDHVYYPSKRIYNITTVQTELILQTSELYKNLISRLARDKRIREICILTDQRTGGAYVRITFY